MAKKPFKDTWLGKLITGKSKLGQVIYGVVDVLPFPNLLNPLRAALVDPKNKTVGDIIHAAYSKTDLIRLLVALACSWAIVSGKLTAETAQQILDIFTQIAG